MSWLPENDSHFQRFEGTKKEDIARIAHNGRRGSPGLSRARACGRCRVVGRFRLGHPFDDRPDRRSRVRGSGRRSGPARRRDALGLRAPDAVGVGGSFAYPADGSVINAGSVTYGAFANPGASATSSASADISTISIFGGDVTVASVSAKVKASANSKKSSADSAGSIVTGLVIQGQPVTPGSGTQFPIGDWGS